MSFVLTRGRLEVILAPINPAPFTGCVWKTTSTDTANADTSTFTAIDIGAEHPNRLVILAYSKGVAAASTSTVNGVDGRVIENTAHEQGISFHPVPNGTTATITLTAVSSARKACAVYVAYPSNPNPLYNSQATQNLLTAATATNVRAMNNGFLIYACGQAATLGAFTPTWAGTETVVEDSDQQVEAISSYTEGHINFLLSSNTNTLTLTPSASGNKKLDVATWGPAPGYGNGG